MEGFTLGMAIMDCIPVLCFSIGAAVIALRLHSFLFTLGILLIILAGALKVTWKFVLALGKKDVRILNRQMRYLMPLGFLLATMGLIVDKNKWAWSDVWRHICQGPSLVCFGIGILGLWLMTYFAFHLDGKVAKNNWKEQMVNGITQFAIMLGIIL